MITGGMGARAVAFFQEYGVQVVTGANGSVRHALEQYLKGQLSGAQPCSEGRGREAAPEVAYTSEKDEVGRLREEINALQDQLAQVLERLSRFETNR